MRLDLNIFLSHVVAAVVVVVVAAVVAAAAAEKTTTGRRLRILSGDLPRLVGLARSVCHQITGGNGSCMFPGDDPVDHQQVLYFVAFVVPNLLPFCSQYLVVSLPPGSSP